MTKKLIISEDDKKEILNQYQGEVNQPLYNHLRRYYTTSVHDIGGVRYVQIFVGDKLRLLNQNKKALTNQIFNDLDENFNYLSVPTRRTTIKKFLSDLVDFYF